MVDVTRGLPTYDGKSARTFPDFRDMFVNRISMVSPKMYQILMGDEAPNPSSGGDLVKWNRANNNLWSILFTAMRGGALTLIKRFRGKSREEGTGDGQSAWNALLKKYDGFSNSSRQKSYEVLTETKMILGQDPDELFYTFDEARDKFHSYGENITDSRLGDLILKAITPDYQYVIDCSVRDSGFGLEEIKTTMRNMFFSKLALRAGTPAVSGRGVAMPTQGDRKARTCFMCNEVGNLKADCPRFDPNHRRNWKKNNNKKGGGGRGSKFCSLHKTTNHSDSECIAKQQAGGTVNFANVGHPCLAPAVASESKTSSEFLGGFRTRLSQTRKTR